MSHPSQAQIDENYRRKIAARADGTTPVLVQIPDPKAIKGDSQAAVDARHRAKIMQREAQAAKAAKADETPAVTPVTTPVASTEETSKTDDKTDKKPDETSKLPEAPGAATGEKLEGDKGTDPANKSKKAAKADETR